MKRFSTKWIIGFILILSFVFLNTASGYAQDEKIKRIIVLNSYHKGFPWTDNIVKGVESVLKPEESNIELIIEYMDTKTMVYDEGYKTKLYELFSYKYRYHYFDLIISSDDNAFNFLREYHEKLFPGTPVVVCGVNNREAPNIVDPSEFTGILETTPHEETINLILDLHPETKKIYLVIDKTPSGKYRWRVTEPSFSRYKDIEFIRLSDDYSISEIENIVGGLPAEAAVIFFTLYRDKSGKYLSMREAISRITKKSTRPVYTTHLLEMTYGVVGGKVLGGFFHGENVANIALHILNGEKVSNIPFVKTSPSQYVFDYAQLERWDIKRSSLPEDSMILNEPFSVYREYKTLIWSIITIIILLVSIIFALQISIRRRKKVETELKNSEIRFRKMIEKSPLPMVITDSNQDISYFNKKFTQLFGYTRRDISTAAEWWKTAYPDEKYRAKVQQSWLTAIQKAEENNSDIDLQEWDLTIKDRSIRNCEFYMVPLDEFSLILVNDITERKKNEADLKHQVLAMDNSSDSIVITDKVGVISYANPAFEKNTGYSRREIMGQNISIIKSGTHDKIFFEELWETISRGRTWSGNIVNKNKSGSQYIEEASISPVFTDNGEIVNYVAVKRDISDRLKLEARLQQAQKMESIGNLAGGIAHDFNNILYPIIGFSEMLLQDLPPDSPEYEDVQDILNAGKRGSELVQQILAFSRQSEHRKIPVKVQRILKEVLKLTRSSIPSDIEIKNDIQTNCGAVIADSTQLHQIAMNLITNAYHAVEKNSGNISVELKETILERNDLKNKSLDPGGYVVLSVSDNGIGISKDNLTKIFEPYFTTKEKGKGTGLGLATVYGIVKQHDGDIQIYTEEGKGTTVRVYLPLLKKNSETIIDKSEFKLQTGTERILLVDDEVSITKLGKRILEPLGYKVIISNSSLDALEKFHVTPNAFDLVITDMTMPHMTGDKLAKEILSIKSDTPIIICTGFSERVSKEKAEDIGVKSFLMKPIVKSEMAQTVRKILDEVKNSTP